MEDIRLVIWDLDETFWNGTLTEGGIKSYIQENHDLVITLAKRGIMNSICSKNDLESIRDLLTERGLWDYFVFPSINWEPKGPRLARQVELFQLRPETVLFIDDNPGNRGEAERFVAGLQVADETIIPTLRDHPRFKGKDDSELSRLRQYKVLEQKNIDLETSAQDPRSFLVDSRIVVRIDHDILAGEDRAIELINRTNQLNFTKSRLPEDIELARAEFRRQASRFDVQGGIVSVRDRYGDYGEVGFYLLKSDGYGSSLIHFCFSCRTLNMGVEAYVYQYLGRPNLTVVGDVLTDLRTHPEVDWINVAVDVEDHEAAATPDVVVHGGCDLSAITHYFKGSSPSIVSELVKIRDGIDFRFDHSALLNFCLFPPSGDVLAELSLLGYAPSDFQTDLLASGRRIRMLGLWGDANFPVYRHKVLGFDVGFSMPGVAWGGNFVAADRDWLLARAQSEQAKKSILHLRDHFECVGLISPEQTARTLEALLDRLPAGEELFMLLANEHERHLTAWANDAKRNVALNAVFRAVQAKHGNLRLIETSSFIHDDRELVDLNHFDRRVYHRIYEHIADIVRAASPPVEARVL